MDFNKRLFRIEDEEGVSEIVGTILTLSITVVLFSSIFAGVQYLETPEGTTFAEFTASYDGNQNITVEHSGGKDLDISKTSLFVLFDDTSHKLEFGTDKVTLFGKDPGEWTTGEKVKLDISEMDPEQDFVELLVMDTSKSQVVWRTEVDILTTVDKPQINNFGVIYPQEWDDSVEASGSCKLFVDVDYPWEKIDKGDVNVLVNLNNLIDYDNGAWDTGWYNMTYKDGYRFTKRIDISANQDNKTYLLEIAVNNAGSNDTISEEFVVNNNKVSNETVGWSSSEYIGLNVGPHTDVTEQPNIVVDQSKISFLPASPTNGDSFTTRAVIENRGGTYAEFDVYFNDTRLNGKTVNKGILHGRIAAGGGQDFIATWTINEFGRHNISVEVANITSPGGEDLRDNDNNATKDVYVAPTILLVDDDHEDNGDASNMRGALEGSDFTYEYYEVKGQQGPPFDKMNKSDIVIWMTGRTIGDEGNDDLVLRHPTLTENDQDNIEKYLNWGNMFWLIGEGIAEDDNIDDDFLEFIGVDQVHSDSLPDPGPSNDYRINGTGDILSDTSYPVYDRSYEGDRIDKITEAHKMILNSESDPTVIGSNFNDTTTEFNDDGLKYKAAFNSFLFSSIRSGHSKMAYRVIKWLGNMEEKSGHDLAISSQEFSTRAPMFKDTVKINATIRNNGQFNETADVRLYVDGELDTTQIQTVTVPRGGFNEEEFAEVSFEWTADSVGEHEILVKVDPFDKIDETNELNNDITYQDYDATISVQFSILVVDDDGSGYGGGLENTTKDVTDQLDKLGYQEQYDYMDLSQVDIPTESDMSEYNSIFWVTGENNDKNKMGIIDKDAMKYIKGYLDNYSDVSFFLEGNHALDLLKKESQAPEEDYAKIFSSFMKDYLGIQNRTIQTQSNLHLIKGIKNDDLSHGMDYLMDGSSYQNITVIDGEAVPILKNKNHIIGAKYNNRDRAFKTVTLGFDLADIEGPDVHKEWYDGFKKNVDISAGPAREEFTYMMSKWFGNVDQRTELRISNVDIDIEVNNPMLGKSYRMTASIQNVGYQGSSALVRFMDGDSLIASESIYVNGNSNHTVEINWEPLFAGYNNSESNINSERNITTLVDPLCEEDEIGSGSDDDMNFNNVDVKRIPVFYFWDNMESGMGNWKHEATLANINGESPIDYLGSGYENVYTDIQSDWDRGMSKGFNVTNYTSHTDPRSYWLTEPKARNESKEESKPIDVVMAIDTSGSMHWAEDSNSNPGANDPNSRMYQAVEAANNFIENMTPKDRLEIWTFDPEPVNPYDYNPKPYLYKELSYMTNGSDGTADNKTEFKQALIDIREGNGVWGYDESSKTSPYWGPVGGTPYYDTLGNAIQSTVDINNNEDRDRLEFVVGLGDGISNSDSEYSPNADWGEITDDGGGDSTGSNFQGLMNAPPMIFNIGFVSNNLHPSDSNYPVAPYWDDSHDGYTEYEEEMFNVANTTPGDWQDKYGTRTSDAKYGPAEKGDPYTGRYYFAEKAEDVGTVFEEVRKIITTIAEQQAEEGNVTSINNVNENSLMSTKTVFADDFESDDWSSPGYSGSWQNSSGTYIESGEPLDGTYSAELYGEYWSGGNNNAYISHPVDLSSISGTINEITLSFWEKRDNANPADDFHIKVNGNDIQGSPFSDEGSNYPYTADITDEATSGGDSFDLRFEQDVKDDRYWRLDNIEITVDYTSSSEGNPSLVYTSPSNDESNVSIDEEITVVFSKSMNTSYDTLDYTCSPNPGGWSESWSNNDQVLTLSHNDFKYDETYTFEILSAEDKDGNQIDDGEAPNPWSFTTITEERADEESHLAYGKNYNKTLVTESFNLENYDSAQLTFWHKYKIVPGTNGGFLQIGYKDDSDGNPDDYDWKYIVPTRGSYTGNMNTSVERYDDFSNSMNWAWNGVSGGGTFSWDYVKVGLLGYVPDGYRDDVKLKFNYTQYGGGSGHGWYIDDVKVIASREMGSSVTNDDMMDVWQQVTTENAYGKDTTAWWNGYMDGSQQKLKEGIDNRLVSTPIDLTRASTVFLNADFKFNLNKSAGAPPDGFRVEVTTDNGVTWMPLNDGARSAMGLSGSESDDDDDGKTSTGLSIDDSNWVKAGSLTRLNIDLSGFSGETVMIRFRMVTNNANNYQHYDVENDLRGFYLDNVMVTGNSLLG